MDSKGIIYTDEEAKSKFAEAYEKEIVQIPQEELEKVVAMNRQQRRSYYKMMKKRGKGYTK